jgi:hypothetical protein
MSDQLGLPVCHLADALVAKVHATYGENRWKAIVGLM